MSEVQQALPWVSSAGFLGMLGAALYFYRELRKVRREDRTAEIEAISKEDAAKLATQANAVDLIRSVMADARKEYEGIIAQLRDAHSECESQARRMQIELDVLKAAAARRDRDATPSPIGHLDPLAGQ